VTFVVKENEASDPSEVGCLSAQTQMPQTDSMLDLLNAGFLTQLRYINSPLKFWEVTLPMVAGDRSLGTVHVAMSTILLMEQLKPLLSKNLYVAGFSLLFATTLAAVFAQVLLNPLTFISAGIERMIQGEFTKPID
jgi:hypothetical protein